ncbi:CoA-binding protein [Streptococcus gordonii]|uniref:CoA-binding protein n=1 Tax=Streptococcus gordonii TaxID=1302 RepID=UPI00077915A0|nr:CoA-binding protein [Streptococcus gordonii]
MTYHFQNPSDTIVKHYLENSKVIAVVGLSDREETTSNRVSKEMQERGYRIIPVNPRAAGRQIFGEIVYASLKDIPFPVDIVDVYRRSEFLPDVARDFLEADAKIFWAQLGLENEEAERILRAAGRDDIVMDRCIKREHTRLILGE